MHQCYGSGSISTTGSRLRARCQLSSSSSRCSLAQASTSRSARGGSDPASTLPRMEMEALSPAYSAWKCGIGISLVPVHPDRDPVEVADSRHTSQSDRRGRNGTHQRRERLKGLEPSTFCMASRRSSQLSYSRIWPQLYPARLIWIASEPLSKSAVRSGRSWAKLGDAGWRSACWLHVQAVTWLADREDPVDPRSVSAVSRDTSGRADLFESGSHNAPPSARPSTTAPSPTATLTSTFATPAVRRPSSARLWVSSIQVENVV
jgi:hypothetical protein